MGPQDCDKVFDAEDSSIDYSYDLPMLVHLSWISERYGIAFLDLTSRISCPGRISSNQSCVFAVCFLTNINRRSLSLQLTGHLAWFALFPMFQVIWFQVRHQRLYQVQDFILCQVCEQKQGQHDLQSKLCTLKLYSFGVWLKTNEFEIVYCPVKTRSTELLTKIIVTPRALLVHIVTDVANGFKMLNDHRMTFPTPVPLSNVTTLKLAKLECGRHTSRLKICRIKLHLSYSLLQLHNIDIIHCSSEEQNFDFLTKALAAIKFKASHKLSIGW